jgi:hypothetical protein
MCNLAEKFKICFSNCGKARFLALKRRCVILPGIRPHQTIFNRGIYHCAMGMYT